MSPRPAGIPTGARLVPASRVVPGQRVLVGDRFVTVAEVRRDGGAGVVLSGIDVGTPWELPVAWASGPVLVLK